jgi:hypothetical protein
MATTENSTARRLDLEQYTTEHAPEDAGWGWRDAIEHAVAHGWQLHTYTDPAAEGREDVSADYAIDVAAEDASLVYVSRPPCYDDGSDMDYADTHVRTERAGEPRAELAADECACDHDGRRDVYRVDARTDLDDLADWYASTLPVPCDGDRWAVDGTLRAGGSVGFVVVEAD